MTNLQQALSYLECLECRGPLAPRPVEAAAPSAIVCESCGKTYRCQGGIPILLRNQQGLTHYDIPWHRVDPEPGRLKVIARGIKTALTELPILRLLIYKALYGPNKLYLTDAVNTRITAGSVVADIGCRNIPYVAHLQRAKIYFAVDIDFDSLLYIRKLEHENVVPILASIDDMPLKSGAADSVICLEVIEHIENDRQAFAELGRILRKGGQMFMTTPDGDTLSVEELPPPRLHLRHYRRSELASHLGAHCDSVRVGSIASWFPFWRLTDYIEAMGREKRSRLARAMLRGAYVACNFTSNIAHAVLEKTPYRKKGHYRLVASCTK